MPIRRVRRRPKSDRRRALELLAANRRGCTEAMMRANGFTIGQIVALARDGLANARAERVFAGTVIIVLRITTAGQRMLRNHRNRSPSQCADVGQARRQMRAERLEPR